MDEIEQRYLETMKALDEQLLGVDRTIQHIADRLLAGAAGAYPKDYKNPALVQIHEELTRRSEQIIEKMKQLHAAFNKRSEAR